MDRRLMAMNGTLLTRRTLLHGAGAAAGGVGALALAACGAGTSTPSPGPAAKESGTIQVLNADWGQLYNDLMTKIGDEFATESGIKVEWDFPPDAQEKLITLTAAGTPPDASYTSWKTQGGLAAKGVLTPLDDYAKKAGLSAKDFNPAMYDASLLQGKLY